MDITCYFNCYEMPNSVLDSLHWTMKFSSSTFARTAFRKFGSSGQWTVTTISPFILHIFAMKMTKKQIAPAIAGCTQSTYVKYAIFCWRNVEIVRTTSANNELEPLQRVEIKVR